jgi:hypothetical protein
MHEVRGRPAAERMPDPAVHEQVRIAADRRGKVRILRERKPEVPDVERLIERLRQRADDGVLEHGGIRAASDARQRFLQALGLEFTRDLEMHAAH